MDFSRGLPRRECENTNPAETTRYLRLIAFCITQLKAQGPSRTCNESEEEEEEEETSRSGAPSRERGREGYVSLK